MVKANWMAILTISSLWSAACMADDAKPAKTDLELQAGVSLSVETMLAESGYPYLWRPLHRTDAMVFSDSWLRPMADIDFQEGDVISRVSKLRSLSLLTIAEYGKTRMFLGVNEDGLVGLHFGAFLHKGRDRSLEMVRMPYLRKPSQETE